MPRHVVGLLVLAERLVVVFHKDRLIVPDAPLTPQKNCDCTLASLCFCFETAMMSQSITLMSQLQNFW